MARKKGLEAPRESADAPVAPVTTKAASFSRVGGSDTDDSKQDRIRRRAHEIYERRMAVGLPGDAEGDWLQAEAELGSQAEPMP